MNIAEIEENIQKLISPINKDEFIYDLLLAYGLPKASITRLKKGSLNLSKQEDELAWKKKVFFKASDDNELYSIIDFVINDSTKMSHEPRFVIVTNFKQLLAKDIQTGASLDITIEDLNKHFDFFLPWAGMEKASYQVENPADVKAAEKMARLYDQIKKDNDITKPGKVHELNVFLSRILFCFFAEDTEIFTKGQFTKAIESHTQEDGSDLHVYLRRLFEVLNSAENERGELPTYLMDFPYVNGKLFEDIELPVQFSRKSRQAILECGSLDWSLINPDIFGSMIQAVVTPEYRGSMGMHYTSVPNIMKVINPLFLENLYEEFERAKGNVEALNIFHERLTNIKIFDPACGSGNFLIIAYKELRKLEMRIFEELNKIDSTLYLSAIQLQQIYGIEIDDFAHEIAILSLWLAEHQMNQEFFNKFGRTNATLPLKASGNIVNGNATQLNWEDICPFTKSEEVYILGNPPYLGARLLSAEQKSDMAKAFEGSNIRFNNLDYIACWFYKGAKLIRKRNAMYAFVSTNSITQGEQVALIWPYIFEQGLEIKFSYKSFKWTNNAKAQAAVICVIIGIGNNSDEKKYLYDGQIKQVVRNISPYLIEANKTIITQRSRPLSNFPAMCFGNMPNDGGHLLLEENEYKHLINNKNARPFIKKFLGAREFINGIDKWCIWITKPDLNKALEVDVIREKVLKVRKLRADSDRKATRELADEPYRFGEVRHKNTDAIIVPCHSSENREYIPIGFLSSDSIIGNSCLAIYNANPLIFGILTSEMHMAWVKAVAGRIKSDYRYSAKVCYNTFPFPEISAKHEKKIRNAVYKILEMREIHSEKTLAQLYDQRKMPSELLEAHRDLDILIDRCYRNVPFKNDGERLEVLFQLYENALES